MELLEFAILAEQRGFDSVFVSDHFQPWRHHGGHAPFSIAWMALWVRAPRASSWARACSHPRSAITLRWSRRPSRLFGTMFPEARDPRRRDPASPLNEVPALGLTWPGAQGAHRAAQRSADVDPTAVDAGADQLPRPVF